VNLINSTTIGANAFEKLVVPNGFGSGSNRRVTLHAQVHIILVGLNGNVVIGLREDLEGFPGTNATFVAQNLAVCTSGTPLLERKLIREAHSASYRSGEENFGEGQNGGVGGHRDGVNFGAGEELAGLLGAKVEPEVQTIGVGLSRSAKAGNRVLGARGDWVAPGKAWDRVSDTQIFGKRDFSLDLAFTRAHTVNIRGKGLAVLDSVAFVGVFVTARRIQNGSLHNDGVPTAEEVTVESISGGVTSGKNERLNTLAVGVLINGVEGFHEEIWYTHGVGGRAVAVVGHLNREGHVITVVGRIEIHSVPALGEMKLEAKSVFAELRGSGQVGSFGVRLLSQTGIADSTVGDQRSIVRPASQISRGHSKTWRESFPSRRRLVSTS